MFGGFIFFFGREAALHETSPLAHDFFTENFLSQTPTNPLGGGVLQPALFSSRIAESPKWNKVFAALKLGSTEKIVSAKQCKFLKKGLKPKTTFFPRVFGFPSHNFV